MILDQLRTEEYHPYYKRYIELVMHQNIVEGLEANLNNSLKLLSKIPENKYDYAYAKDKWTIKEVLIHIIDTERIFAYRALRVARNDKTALAGFEQDHYISNAEVESRTFNSIVEEYKAVRISTISLFQSFKSTVLEHIGTASDASVSVRALGYILVGHENHHINVLNERYL